MVEKSLSVKHSLQRLNLQHKVVKNFILFTTENFHQETKLILLWVKKCIETSSVKKGKYIERLPVLQERVEQIEASFERSLKKSI